MGKSHILHRKVDLDIYKNDEDGKYYRKVIVEKEEEVPLDAIKNTYEQRIEEYTPLCGKIEELEDELNSLEDRKVELEKGLAVCKVILVNEGLIDESNEDSSQEQEVEEEAEEKDDLEE